jgi:hypothetical protein
MRYTTVINNVKSKDWGLNLPQAYLFAWLYEVPSWAESISVEGVTYYFASKNKAVEELPMLTSKRDTMTKHYAALVRAGLIQLIKVSGKDYIALTELAKQWNYRGLESMHPEVGNISEGRKYIRGAEINPSDLGNKSEPSAEIYPTYKRISNYKGISDKGIPSLEEFLDYGRVKCLAAGIDYEAKRSAMELKYEAWFEAGWKAGKALKPIMNWKTTLMNTIPYLNEQRNKDYGTQLRSW